MTDKFTPSMAADARVVQPGETKSSKYVARDAAGSGYGPGKNPASHNTGDQHGKTIKIGEGKAGKIELVHGVDLPDTTRGGRKVIRNNQVAVRVTHPKHGVSHTYFGRAGTGRAEKAGEQHFNLMTGKTKYPR